MAGQLPVIESAEDNQLLATELARSGDIWIAACRDEQHINAGVFWAGYPLWGRQLYTGIRGNGTQAETMYANFTLREPDTSGGAYVLRPGGSWDSVSKNQISRFVIQFVANGTRPVTTSACGVFGICTCVSDTVICNGPLHALPLMYPSDMRALSLTHMSWFNVDLSSLPPVLTLILNYNALQHLPTASQRRLEKTNDIDLKVRYDSRQENNFLSWC